MIITGCSDRDINELQEIVCAFLGMGMTSSEIVADMEDMYGIMPTEGEKFVEHCVDFLRNGNKE